jgi:two-component system, NtrC family, nitrogen regulation response regulator NtrX
MTPTDPETVLVVDDEEPVRRTFREWLEGARLGVRVLAAHDAEEALTLANRHRIDLAILDWNLGAGSDGLRLLEDLTLFNPDVVAIMITGFADQATPLDAMRMGVRDYFDKNQELTRDKFLDAVRKQLDRIRPARRERKIHEGLAAFRSAVEKVLPLVQAAAALHDPLPLPDAVTHLFRFLLSATGARDGALLVRCYDPARDPAEELRVYDVNGRRLDVPLAPFARSLAATATSLQEPCALRRPEDAAGVELQPFERGRSSLLAAPLSVGPNLQAVLELFDKEGGFGDADRRLAGSAAAFGAELLRHGLAERQTQRVLFDAVAAALDTSRSLSESLQGAAAARPEDPPPPAVLDRLREGLADSAAAAEGIDAADTVRLAEAIRVLAVRHGPPALRHCLRLIEDVRALLDQATAWSVGSRQ